MDKTVLNVDDLNVESFTTTTQAEVGSLDRCSGCVSTCGIVGSAFTDIYC